MHELFSFCCTVDLALDQLQADLVYFAFICVMAVCFLRRLRDSFVTIDSHVPNIMSFPSRNKPVQQPLQNHG